MKSDIALLLLIPSIMFSQLSISNGNDYLFHENSITYQNGTKKLYPSLLGGVKIGLTGAAMISFGMVPQHRKPFLVFDTSSQKVENPTFEFKLNNQTEAEFAIDGFDRFYKGALSPKEFILIKLKTNTKKQRRYIFKEKGSWRTKISSKIIPFSFEEVDTGNFVVRPNQVLDSGEYCFVHQDILSSENFRDFAFFDFTIE